MQMMMTPDETQIQILANWPMSHAKRVTRDNWKNPEYRVIAAIRKLQTKMLPVYVGSIFVCGPLHHYVLLFSIFGAVGLFRSDMLLIFYMVWP